MTVRDSQNNYFRN